MTTTNSSTAAHGQARTRRVRRTEWRYRGVLIERSAITGYYLAHTTRGLTADTLDGIRELIRDNPPQD